MIFEQGDLLFRSTRNREALSFLQEGIAVYSRNADVNDFDRFGMKMESAYATHDACQPKEAEAICAAALRDCEQVHRGEYPMTAMLQKCQADLFIMQGQLQKGLAILEKSVAIHRRVLGTNHINTLEAESLERGPANRKGTSMRQSRFTSICTRAWRVGIRANGQTPRSRHRRILRAPAAVWRCPCRFCCLGGILCEQSSPTGVGIRYLAGVCRRDPGLGAPPPTSVNGSSRLFRT